MNPVLEPVPIPEEMHYTSVCLASFIFSNLSTDPRISFYIPDARLGCARAWFRQRHGGVCVFMSKCCFMLVWRLVPDDRHPHCSMSSN